MIRNGLWSATSRIVITPVTIATRAGARPGLRAAFLEPQGTAAMLGVDDRIGLVRGEGEDREGPHREAFPTALGLGALHRVVFDAIERYALAFEGLAELDPEASLAMVREMAQRHSDGHGACAQTSVQSGAFRTGVGVRLALPNVDTGSSERLEDHVGADTEPLPEASR